MKERRREGRRGEEKGREEGERRRCAACRRINPVSVSSCRWSSKSKGNLKIQGGQHHTIYQVELS